MSMMWMRMPTQSWVGSGVSFLVVWIVMMAAMMLPIITPVLRRVYGEYINTGEPHPGLAVFTVGIGYVAAWALAGVVVFAFGATLTSVEIRSRMFANAVPFMTGGVVIVAGAIQFTNWKAARLACCTRIARCAGHHLLVGVPVDLCRWLDRGIRIGIDCVSCCANLTVILLVLGMMDLEVMVAVGGAITVERLLPGNRRIAQVIGLAASGLGVLLLARALGG